MVDVVLQTVEIVLDNRYETFVICPLEWSDGVLFARADTLEHVAFGNTNEGEHLVDVREPEDARDDAVLAVERLDRI